MFSFRDPVGVFSPSTHSLCSALNIIFIVFASAVALFCNVSRMLNLVNLAFFLAQFLWLFFAIFRVAGLRVFFFAISWAFPRAWNHSCLEFVLCFLLELIYGFIHNVLRASIRVTPAIFWPHFFLSCAVFDICLSYVLHMYPFAIHAHYLARHLS